MPIKKGNTTIGAIYKGTTQIAKVYKGTKLLFENAVWLDYYFKNLYHDLVPETLPKNLFDGEIEGGYINESTGVIYEQANSLRSKNYISVIGGTSYTLSHSNFVSTAMGIFEYGSDYSFIQYQVIILSGNVSGSKTLNANTKYVKFGAYSSGSGWGSNPPSQDVAQFQFYNKTLSVKNKAKVSVIEANGVVENQLVDDNVAERSIYGYTFDITDGVCTITKDSMGDYGNLIQLTSIAITGHKYFFYCDAPSFANIKLSSSVLTCSQNDFATAQSGSQSNLRIRVSSENVSWTAGTTIKFRAMAFDLTLMFGTGNEPTTLTDNRIQALLNRGYIPYNTGTYKGTDIGLFSSEPYNLFDGEWTQNSCYNETTGAITSDNREQRSTNLIPVMGGKQYSFEFDATQDLSGWQSSAQRQIAEYDKDGNFIKYTFRANSIVSFSSSWDITLSQNTAFVGLGLYNGSNARPNTSVCIHLTGTRTGYAPHQTFTPIAFKYQGNGAIDAHDTMTITKDNVVFGKNLKNANFSDLGPWTYDSSHTRFYSEVVNNLYKVPVDNNTVANMLCYKYTTLTQTTLFEGSEDKSISYSSSGRISIRDTSLNGDTSLISGNVMIELATPQTITIPRKHLAVVDLGSLDWYSTTVGDTTRVAFYTTDLSGLFALDTTKKDYFFCSKYMSVTPDEMNGLLYQGIAMWPAGQVRVFDSSKESMTGAQFKSAMTGVYLFYKTQDEVADIADTLEIEPGGTLTSNLFTWVENQIVYDGNFANGTNDWFCLGTVYSQSVTNNVMTVTKNAGGAGLICSKSNSDITYTAGHKFVALAQVKPSRNCTLNFDVSTVQTGQSMTANVWNTLSYFANPSSLTNYYFAIAETTNTLQVNDTVQIKNVMLIDLTQAFGSGNEPTSVNDPRIQYIINKGYIPTNTTGTYKLVDTEVLPNVEFKLKCK